MFPRVFDFPRSRIFEPTMEFLMFRFLSSLALDFLESLPRFVATVTKNGLSTFGFPGILPPSPLLIKHTAPLCSCRCPSPVLQRDKVMYAILPLAGRLSGSA